MCLRFFFRSAPWAFGDSWIVDRVRSSAWVRLKTSRSKVRETHCPVRIVVRFTHTDWLTQDGIPSVRCRLKNCTCRRQWFRLLFRHLANNRNRSNPVPDCESPMPKDIAKTVRSKYAAVAQSGLSTGQAGVRAVAEAFGYTPDQLASIPAEANMGLSCGNPTAFASLKPGETVVDLGCGGGLDVFLAAKRVGPSGRAVGIDMTPEMLDLARRNAKKADGGKPMKNVEFHLATIDKLPLRDACVDCVISNCVINLAPDKRAVFREIVRVLKPGGRLAASDIALKKPLPPALGNDLMAYVGCIAGAIPMEDYRLRLTEAGFANVEIIDAQSDLNAYAKVENQSGCCSPSMESATSQASAGCCCCSSTSSDDADLHRRLAELLRQYDVNEYAASVRVFAVKAA
jgi:arsenite methyltransferase